MKTNTFFLLSFFALSLMAGNLLAQSQKDSHPSPPSLPGMAGLHEQATKVGDQWTTLSEKDDLLFEARKGTCDGNGMLMMKVQNKSAKEVHVFVSLSLQDGMSAPRQVLILKAHQVVEIGCRPTVPFMPMLLREGQEPVVSLEYTINKQL